MKALILANGISIANLDGNGGGELFSDIPRQLCPHCGEPMCMFSCDESQAGGFTDEGKEVAETDDDTMLNRIKGNISLDAIESFVLNLVTTLDKKGVDLELWRDDLNCAINSTLDAIDNNER